MERVEHIKHGNRMLAIIVRKAHDKEGLTFVTGPEYGLQVGVHKQKKGWTVRPHVHLPFDELKNLEVQEMLNMVQGAIDVDLYDDSGKILASVVVEEGDTIILICGHGIRARDDCRILEVKQGPYRGQSEKRYFS